MPMKMETSHFIILIAVCLCIIFVCAFYKKDVEKFVVSAQPTLPVDADNPNLTDTQLYGLIPYAASASIFKKKEARDFAANIDSLPIDPKTGGILFTSSMITINPDGNDIETYLNQQVAAQPTTRSKKDEFTDYKVQRGFPLENFDGAASALSSQAQTSTQDNLQSKVQDKVKETALKSKTGKALTSVVLKNVEKVQTKISAKMANRFGATLVNKLMAKVSAKIAESLGQKVATASATGATLSSNPVTVALGVLLSVIAAAASTLQVYMTVTLKGEDGFCPPGWTLLGSQIPDFLSQIPAIGDILGTMGPYLCYRNSCEANEDEDAGLCYPKCDTGYGGIGPVCWANKTDVGAGVLKDCPAGWTNTGLTCNEPITTTKDPCPSGTRDVAGSCWGTCDNCVGGCGGDCGAWKCCGCSWKSHTDCIKVGLADRHLKTTGGTVKGRAAGSDLPCSSSAPVEVDGLCYKTCPDNTPNRIPGMPYLCSAASRVGDGRGATSYGRGVGKPKLKMQPVTAPPPPPTPPPATSSAAFADDPTTSCKADFSSPDMLKKMCDFYYKASVLNPTPNTDGTLSIQYISKITKVVASSEQSCDIFCDITVLKINAATNAKVSSNTYTDNDRRFYFAKIVNGCMFLPTGATSSKGLAPDVYLPDSGATTVLYTYIPILSTTS